MRLSDSRLADDAGRLVAMGWYDTAEALLEYLDLRRAVREWLAVGGVLCERGDMNCDHERATQIVPVRGDFSDRLALALCDECAAKARGEA